MFGTAIFLSVIEDVQCICRDRVVCFYIMYVFIVPYCYCFPVWPTYYVLHVLHCNPHITLEFVLSCGVLSCSWLYMVLHVVHLNRLGTLCMSGLWYLNVTHFFLCVCVGVFSVFCVLIILFFKLWMIWNGKPLFLAIVQIVTHSCCLACSVIGVDNILLT